MKLYSVTYGLKEETEIEKWLRFLNKIKGSYDWHHPIETVWFIKSEKSSREIFEDLYEPGTFNGFIVTEVDPKSIEAWASNAFWMWLKEELHEH